MRDIWYLVLPLIISALITPVVKQIGYRLDAFAQMNERTVHHGKIVRIGGVAIYLAFIITMALYVKTDMAMNGILIGSTIMFIGGLVDDLVNLKPLYKFSFQVVAAIVLIACHPASAGHHDQHGRRLLHRDVLLDHGHHQRR